MAKVKGKKAGSLRVQMATILRDAYVRTLVNADSNMDGVDFLGRNLVTRPAAISSWLSLAGELLRRGVRPPKEDGVEWVRKPSTPDVAPAPPASPANAAQSDGGERTGERAGGGEKVALKRSGTQASLFGEDAL